MNIYIKKQGFLIKKIIAWIIISFLLLLLLNIFQNQFKNIFYIVSSPFINLFSQSGKKSANFFGSFLNISKLKGDNDILKEENQNLLSKIYFLQEYLKEDLSLKEAEKNVRPNNFDLVLSKIIGLDIINDSITIDRGYNDGISENMPVISGQKVLYGRVFKVYENFSEVILISNRNSALDAKVYQIESDNSDDYSRLINGDSLSKDSIRGVVKGRGNLSIYLDLVLFDADIKKDDILTTSALDGIFPRGLLIGKVAVKDKDDLKPFQTAEIQPFFDIVNMEDLFVITNYKRP